MGGRRCRDRLNSSRHLWVGIIYHLKPREIYFNGGFI